MKKHISLLEDTSFARQRQPRKTTSEKTIHENQGSQHPTTVSSVLDLGVAFACSVNECGVNECGGNECGGNERGGNERGGNERGGNERGGNERR
jgi:hypothetical protein